MYVLFVGILEQKKTFICIQFLLPDELMSTYVDCSWYKLVYKTNTKKSYNKPKRNNSAAINEIMDILGHCYL